MTQGIYSAYLGVAIALIFREIYSATQITVNTIQGGICVYLMLGFLWALFYGMTSTLDPNAFTQTLFGQGEGYTQVTYFSFTTLTTLACIIHEHFYRQRIEQVQKQKSHPLPEHVTLMPKYSQSRLISC